MISFYNSFAPTEPQDHLGLQHTVAGRRIYRTTKLEIGIRAGEQRTPQDAGISATAIQDWILGVHGAMRPDPRLRLRGLPVVIKTAPTRWERIVRVLRAILNWRLK